MSTLTKGVISVVSADDMDAETLYKHLNARHLHDLGMNAEMYFSEEYSESLIGSHRAFHARVHALALSGHHDHVHEDQP
jgi:hypothetical protein